MDKYYSMSDDKLRELTAQREGWTGITTKPNIYIFEHLGVVWMGRNINGEIDYIPNWPQNAADALALLQQTGYMLWWNGGEWEVQDILNGKRGEPGSHGFSIPIITSHQNPARAITIAFLRWQDAQEDGE